MGGKPKKCDLENFEIKENIKGIAKPEFITTFKDYLETIIVVECKNNVKKHSTEDKNKPSLYAEDGVLYYSKYLKNEFNVIAVAVSGTEIEKLRVTTFYWEKGKDKYSYLKGTKDVILEPLNYIKLINGEED